MKLSRVRPMRCAVFDEPNLLAAAGLVPIVALADRVGLQELADRFLTVPTDKGANAGLKVTSVVAGMVAGADSIDDMVRRDVALVQWMHHEGGAAVGP